MTRPLALLLLCAAAGCRGSGQPWRHVEAELQEKGRVTVTVKGSLTGFEASVVAEGPAKLRFDREEPEPPASPVVPAP